MNLLIGAKFRPCLQPMGFADLSISDIAAEYNLPVKRIFALCNRLNIAYKNERTYLALEDAKAVITSIIAERNESNT